jgi:hypothetical protein
MAIDYGRLQRWLIHSGFTQGKRTPVRDTTRLLSSSGGRDGEESERRSKADSGNISSGGLRTSTCVARRKTRKAGEPTSTSPV